MFMRGVFVKNIILFSFLILFTATAFAASLDINIIYEASRMKVKEKVCGVTPDLEKGYVETEDGCFKTSYELDVPMYGFTFEPRTLPDAELTKCAYYISFFDSAFPKTDLVTTEVYKDDKFVRKIENLVHERTFQGLALLKKGEHIRLSSKAEPSYTVIYIIAAIIVAIGMFFILRKRR